MKTLNRVLNIVVTAVLIVALLAVGSTVLARFTPIRRGFVPTVTLTGSMLPTIKINAISIVRYCDISEVREGDIIIYYNSEKGANIIHRAIGIEGEGDERVITTKGDNNRSPDAMRTTRENFIGIAVLTFNSLAPLTGRLLRADGTGLDPVKLFIFLAGCALGLWLVCAALIKLVSKLTGKKAPPERGEDDENTADKDR